MSWVMSVSNLQCWDWNWLPAKQQAVRALLTSARRWSTTHGLGFSACEVCGIRSLHSHGAALWVQLPMIPEASSGTASLALNSTMPQFPILKKVRRSLPFPSCAISVLIQVLWDKHCLLLDCVECLNKMNLPSKHPLLPHPTLGWLPAIWILFHAETLMPWELHAMQGMWQILLLGTNSSQRNKSSNLIQNAGTHPVYRGQTSISSYSSFPKHICLVQTAEVTSQLQGQEPRMFRARMRTWSCSKGKNIHYLCTSSHLIQPLLSSACAEPSQFSPALETCCKKNLQYGDTGPTQLKAWGSDS